MSSSAVLAAIKPPAFGVRLRRATHRLVRACKISVVVQLQALRRLRPSVRRHWRALRENRIRAEDEMSAFASAASERFDGAVLVDGTFDNANYWLRLSLMRRALGTAHAKELGFTGPYAAREARATFRRIGIKDVVDINACATSEDRAEAARQAHALIARSKTPGDVLDWQLPFEFPAMMLYDEILKQQRQATFDLDDPLLFDRVNAVLIRLFAADRLLDRAIPKLVLLSHVGPLAWVAARRAIPSIVLFGHFGVLRFFKIIRPEDVFDPYDHPTGTQIDALPDARADALEAIGGDYISHRFAGKTDDIGSRFAFKKDAIRLDRATLAAHFGWDPERRIVAVYASNWFDYPHFLGMSHFRDFLDWLRATLTVAHDVSDVNWLFKGHPADAFYGGITLADLMPDETAPHIRLVPTDWSGSDVREHVDALVTYHGTAGVEFGAMGKPVLLADRGWYHDCGFALWPRSRADYLAALRRPWWRDLDRERCTRRARIFAGWFFASPTWQGGFILNDDSEQLENYAGFPALLRGNQSAVRREVDAIKQWTSDEARYYNTYKMGKAEAFCLATVLT